MQALRDAGIVLVVILLAVTVRFTPLDEAQTGSAAPSLTPQTEAAQEPPPEPRRVEATPVNEVEFVGPLDVQDIEDVEHCTELMFRLQRNAGSAPEQAFQTEEEVRVLACSA